MISFYAWYSSSQLHAFLSSPFHHDIAPGEFYLWVCEFFFSLSLFLILSFCDRDKIHNSCHKVLLNEHKVHVERIFIEKDEIFATDVASFIGEGLAYVELINVTRWMLYMCLWSIGSLCHASQKEEGAHLLVDLFLSTGAFECLVLVLDTCFC